MFLFYRLGRHGSGKLSNLSKVKPLSCGGNEFIKVCFIPQPICSIIILPPSLLVIMICFFCRQNPETTFEVYVEVAYPRSGGTLSGICMFDYDMACLFIV